MINHNWDPEAVEPQIPLPETPEPSGSNDDGKLVHIGTFITRADHYRLRSLGIDLHLSLQRMGHRAWNSFLVSQGLPGLTAVCTGRRVKPPKRSA